MKNFLMQDKVLLNDILERHYYSKFRQGEGRLELFLLGKCKANCEYCYLKKHGRELYPIELQSKENILKNYEKVLKWYTKNKFHNQLEFFSGEWITTDLCIPIFDITYNIFNNALPNARPPLIIFPDNMLFIYNKELTDYIQKQIDRFKKDLNISLIFSASVDGKICDFGRTKVDDTFYKNLINFLDKNDFGIHPMISSNNVKYWIDNYLWWQENAPKKIADNMMSLEVRDETWTTESITDLIKFCDFVIDYRIKNVYNNDLVKFADSIFTGQGLNGGLYQPFAIKKTTNFTNNRDFIDCSFSQVLPIRIGDLSIGLCHRLYYDDLIIGQYELNDQGEILNCNPKNLSLIILKTHLRRSCLPHCENCQFVGICELFCLGNAYENSMNPLIPIKENCDMQKAKYSFLLYKYNSLGLFNKNIIDNTHLSLIDKQYLLDLKDKVLNGLEVNNCGVC